MPVKLLHFQLSKDFRIYHVSSPEHRLFSHSNRRKSLTESNSGTKIFLKKFNFYS